MNHKKKQAICNIVFGLSTAGLFYLMPYIAWHTMEGDKTDILMGVVLGFIPMGLLLFSFLYGLLAKRVVAPACMASILGLPAAFIPVVAGHTIGERLFSLVFITIAILIIVCAGTASGIFIRRLSGKD